MARIRKSRIDKFIDAEIAHKKATVSLLKKLINDKKSFDTYSTDTKLLIILMHMMAVSENKEFKKHFEND